MRIRSLMIGASLLSLGGCASVPEQVQTPDTAISVALSYAELAFEPLPGDDDPVELGPDCPVFAFPEGKSYLKAFALPARHQPGFLDFRSTPFGGSTMGSHIILIPRFAFLDQDKNFVDASTAASIARTTSAWSGSAFSGQVPIPAQASFAVIYAADATKAPLVDLSANGTPWPVPLSRMGKTEVAYTTLGKVAVSDSAISESRTKAQLFVVAEVDGKSIRNAQEESRQFGYGGGPAMTTVLTTRHLPSQRMLVKLVATHQTGAPIHQIFSRIAGTYLTVEGVVDFEPAAGRSYIVKGILNEAGSSVWIEDMETGQPITQKITSK